MKIKYIIIIIFSILVSNILSSTETQKVENLEAFSRLYGYIRFFHPSDEAQLINWDKFAVYGTEEVLKAKSTDELKAILHTLFDPFTAGLIFYSNKENASRKATIPMPLEIKDYNLTYWQHIGMFNTLNLGYKQIRVNKSLPFPKDKLPILYFITKTFSPKPSTTYRLSYYVKTIDKTSNSTVFMYGNINDSYDSVVDSKSDTVITSEWSRKELEIKTPADAYEIKWMQSLESKSTILLDSMKIEVKINNQWQLLKDDFISSCSDGKIPTQISTPRNMDYAGNKDCFVETIDGKKLLVIRTVAEDQKFVHHSDAPHVADSPLSLMCEKQLNHKLFCTFPLALYTDQDRTYPRLDTLKLSNLTKALTTIDTKNTDSAFNRISAVIIYWSALQHFYPYWNYTDTNWNKVLTYSLTKALRDTSVTDTFYTLSAMSSKTFDSHTGIRHPILPDKIPPFGVQLIEKKWMVTKTDSCITNLPLGSEVLSYNGKKFKKFMQEAKPFFIRASEQATNNLLFNRAVRITGDTTAIFTFKLPDGRISERKIDFINASQYKYIFPQDTLKVFEDGIVYLNINNMREAEYNKHLPELAQAKKIIIDFRGYPPFMFDTLLPNFIDSIKVAYMGSLNAIIYPDSDLKNPLPKSQTSQRNPAQPRIKGKTVFLCNASSQSKSESFLALAKYFKCATILGEPTSGSTGNVINLDLPGQFSTWFTGRFVKNPDGSRFHGIGVIPDIIVHPTEQGVQSGKDEILEAALSYLRSQ